MRKHLSVLLSLVLAMLLIAVCASAAEDPMTLDIELSQTKFSEPARVDVTIKVSNIGNTDMPGPVTLYDPDGKQIEAFGSPTLAAGASKSWTGTWDVTQEQLNDGKITFRIRYSVYNDNNELINKGKSISKLITNASASSSVVLERTVTPVMAGKGTKVTITYTLQNTGNLAITEVVLKENKSIDSTEHKVASIAPGETHTFTFTKTMGTKDLTSSATLTYKAGSKNYTITKDETTIRYGNPVLVAEMTADKKGAPIGDTVRLTIKLTNKGDLDLNNIRVSEPQLGEIFSGLSIAKGKSITETCDITVKDSATYMLNVTATEPSGIEVSAVSGQVSVVALDPSKMVSLSVRAAADSTTVYTEPGTGVVQFTVSVTNDSPVDAKDVYVYASGVQLYHFASIPAGETRSFVRDVQVSMSGKYRFDATVKDAIGQSVTFGSNTLQINYAAPTPVPTDVPIVTPPRPVYATEPASRDIIPARVTQYQQIIYIVMLVALALSGLGLVLVVIGIIRRINSKNAADKAQDSLEVTGVHDYRARFSDEEEDAVPAKPERKGKKVPQPAAEEAASEPAETPAEAAAPAEEIVMNDDVSDMLKSIYPETAEGAPHESAAAPVPTQYRRRHRNNG